MYYPRMMFLTVIGLCICEIVSSLDNAVVNAEVLGTMRPKARKWFLVWGILTSVFLVRGLLPWIIVWLASPGIGFLESFTATLSSDGRAAMAIEKAAPVLLGGGGTFLLFLFLHWLFREDKHFGLPGERFISRHGAWFYTVASAALMLITWEALQIDPILAFSATVGSTAFFLSHGFKEYAERAEKSEKRRDVRNWDSLDCDALGSLWYGNSCVGDASDDIRSNWVLCVEVVCEPDT